MAAEGRLDFQGITKLQMREWVAANPDRINDKDARGDTPLFVAAVHHESVPRPRHHQHRCSALLPAGPRGTKRSFAARHARAGYGW